MAQSRAAFIDRSLVAIFDIESFTMRNMGKQAALIEAFVAGLTSNLNSFANDLRPDAYSTGDGAIVSIGRNCSIDHDTVDKFLGFVLGFARSCLSEGLILRTAVNYSEHDRVLLLDPDGPLKGEALQVGDAINDAARIITFCEPREVLVGASVVKLMRDLDLEDAHEFLPNEPLITKHQQTLLTATYVPARADTEIFYNPHCSVHAYKRFSNFPPIKSDTLEYFMENGLDLELRKVITSAYDALATINETTSFLSWNPVLRVLCELTYDPDDSVYVLWRHDVNRDFWTQARSREYLQYLTAHAGVRPAINQTRVLTYTTDDTFSQMPADHIFFKLKELHGEKTFFNFPASQLYKYELLAELRFGFTLSRKHGYVIIPVPAPDDVKLAALSRSTIGAYLEQNKDYDPADGPMKAFISADPHYVEALAEQMDVLIADPVRECLK